MDEPLKIRGKVSIDVTPTELTPAWATCMWEQSLDRSLRKPAKVMIIPVDVSSAFTKAVYNKRANKVRKNVALGRLELRDTEVGSFSGMRIIEDSRKPNTNTKAVKQANKRKKQKRALTGRR